MGILASRVVEVMRKVLEEEAGVLGPGSEKLLRHCRKDAIDMVVEVLTLADPDKTRRTVFACRSRSQSSRSLGAEGKGREGRLMEERRLRTERCVENLRMTYRMRWAARVGLVLALALAGLSGIMWLSDLSSTQDGTLLTYVPPGRWPLPA